MLDFSQIVLIANEMRASDIHISAGLPPIARVDGQMTPIANFELTQSDCSDMVKSVLTPRQQQIYDEKGEVDFAYTVGDEVRLRVNVYQQSGTYAIAARLLSSRVKTMRELGLPESLEELHKKRRGLILVTGVTGSGKTTTLASLVNLINQNFSEHIITIEEPVEYIYPPGKSIIHQREVGADTSSFPVALRSALRQDPDVILVGEMRDLETISTAITAAETGHLVLSTLHTLGVVGSIDRIIDVFPPEQQQQIRLQLSEVLECVVSQQLLPSASGEGRVVATEIMLSNYAIKSSIREAKSHQIPNIISTGRKQGMMSMDDSIYDLYLRGKITSETALLYAVNREAMSLKVV